MKKLIFKVIALIFIFIASLFSLQLKNIKAKEILQPKKNQNLKEGEEELTSTVRCNMLNIHTAVVTDVRVVNLIGTTSKITATFGCLPATKNKIMAVLVEKDAGGVIDTQFLDENRTVVFNNIPKTLKMPGIHLYKQSPTDPDFVLRRENFIASTSYLMPTIKKNTDEWYFVTPYTGEGEDFPVPAGCTFYKTSEPNIFSIGFPSYFLHALETGIGVTPRDVIVAVIPEDDDGKPLNPADPHKQYTITDYKELGALDWSYCFRVEFKVPLGTTKFLLTMYKNSLTDENFLCRIPVDLNNL